MTKRFAELQAKMSPESREASELKALKYRREMAQYLGVNDAEAYSGISKWTWRRKAYAGEIASTKVGKRLLIPKSEIDRILAAGYRPKT